MAYGSSENMGIDRVLWDTWEHFVGNGSGICILPVHILYPSISRHRLLCILVFVFSSFRPHSSTCLELPAHWRFTGRGLKFVLIFNL
jgi:hypothetical protein